VRIRLALIAAVTILAAIPASSQVDTLLAHWLAPTAGGAVDSYVVRVYTSSDTLFEASALDTFFEFPSDTLTDDTPYRFSTAGVNTAGEGPSARTDYFAWSSGDSIYWYGVLNLSASVSSGRVTVTFADGTGQDATQIMVTDPSNTIFHSVINGTGLVIPGVTASDTLDVSAWAITGGERGNRHRAIAPPE